MKITQVKVYPYTKKKLNGEIGIGQVVLDDLILLTGLKLVERHNKHFVLYPVNYRNKRQLCFVQPIKKPIADEICNMLFEAYNTALENKETNAEDSVFMTGLQEMVDDYEQQRDKLAAIKAAADALQNAPASDGPEPTADLDNVSIGTGDTDELVDIK